MFNRPTAHIIGVLLMLSLIVLFMSVAGAKEVKKFHVGDDVQWQFQHLYDNCGLECLLTFEAESGMVLDSISRKQNSNGTSDYGFCQLNSQYHSPFIFGYEYRERKAHWNKVKDLRYIVAQLEKKLTRTVYNPLYTYKGETKGLIHWRNEKALAEAFMVQMSTFTEGFLDARTQLDYCIGVFKDAKKKGRIRTTWYAFAHINTRPGVRDRFNITK